LDLTVEERAELERWVRRRKGAQDLALRARLVLACAASDEDGLPASTGVVAASLGVSRETVSKWRKRFLADRVAGLSDEPRPGRPRTVRDGQVADLIERTLESEPENATHWSTRSMAKKTGLSQSTVSRVWRAFGLQPHRSETFKLSTDPFFADKVHDVAGLYLDPPERALVLCVDEKSRIQALNRSQPVWPMMPGVPERASHDYVRAGTTTLFAALDAATGQVIGSLHRRHRAEEFKKFLTKLDKEVPGDLQVHLVLDNHATHKTPAVKKWLLSHPRFHTHFTPTSSSWLNLVERWFGELTNKRIRPGVHKPVQALEKDIRTWTALWNEDPKPFVWTKPADQILDALTTYCRRITDSEH
jgi:transposase